ncbi:MAG TPA: bifunctional phosphopantothenoylcysteine decarboxylase/phosphopantothenate--cysteine ligase CoaBC [Hyphomicrobium sp.]|nr:bifunctional phosphopantothenoylcysteine decarboxylase/phosphopantothenate--cysteine ligase CoaBC [Hyphomicrobium sp.]
MAAFDVKQQRILLIISGGIAAYKCLDLVRRLRDEGASLRAVMTRAAAEFVTPLSVAALTNERVFTELFDLNDEHEIGHIRLSREADLIIVAPATADLIAKMAGGHADDLASTVLMATDKPVLVAPAMNPRMWLHPATQRNVAVLKGDGIRFVGPNTGEMAERDEAGPGRLAEVPEIIAAARAILSEGGRSVTRLRSARPLAGRHVLVTSGPTHEPIDPVRYIANRSSGRQGHAVAAVAARMGARVTLVSGPVALADPPGVDVVRVETAEEMLAAVERSLPADVAVFAAAVADWRTAAAPRDKLKKTGEKRALDLVENPDILATVGKARERRPPLVIGFAAETRDVVAYAGKKRKAKGADWLVANDVSAKTGVLGGASNTVHLVTADGVEDWPTMAKEDVAERLMLRAAEFLRRSTAAAE